MTQDDKPDISVVMPCFNYASYIAEAIGSIVAQGIEKIQIIVVDDGSTDASAEIASNVDGRVECIRQANAGIVEPPVEGVKAGAAPKRPHVHLVTQGREAAAQPRDSHERSAALPWVQRCGGENRDAQGRPGADRG